MKVSQKVLRLFYKYAPFTCKHLTTTELLSFNDDVNMSGL